MQTAYAKAASCGYPYLRGEGKAKDGIWFSRFTKKADGKGPALWVGFDHDTFKWIVKYDKE